MPPPIDNALISSNNASGLAVRGRRWAWPAVPTGRGAGLTGEAGATTSASATGAGAVTAGAAATGAGAAGAVVVLDVDVVVVAVVVESACATSLCTARGAVVVESAVVVD